MDQKSIDFIVTAPGKVILHGEHSVVYGKTAVAASLNLKTTLKYTSAESKIPTLVLDLPCLEFSHSFVIKDLNDFLKKNEVPLLTEAPHRTFCLNNPESIDFDKIVQHARLFVISQKLSLSKAQENAVLSFLCLFWGMFSSVDLPLPNCVITITSELNIGAGMGSSTTYNVCLSAAFLQYIRRNKLQPLSEPCEISKGGYKSFRYWSTDLEKFETGELDLISRWGHLGDKIMHGNPSGIDNAVCTYGSVIEFRKGSHTPDIKIIPDPKFLKILLVNTKVSRDTKQLVSKVASLKDRFPCVIDPILVAMDSIAISACKGLRRMSELGNSYDPRNCEALEETLSKEISKLEELIDINQKLLESLGVSHDSLDVICQIAKSEGLHGKMTGAGGGGYAFVLLPFRDFDKQLCGVKMGYERLHFPVQQVTLGGPGVMLEDISLAPCEEKRQSSGSLHLSMDKLSAPAIHGKVDSSYAEIREPNLITREQEELDEWPWPFDLREVVKSMFENQVKEDLQGGEIAIPLKSLCAINVPDPLPQWMDKITDLQGRITPSWRNIFHDQIRKSKDENARENVPKLKRHGSNDDLLEDISMQGSGIKGQKYKITKKLSITPDKLRGNESKIGKRISVNLMPRESLEKRSSVRGADYHIPTQAIHRGSLFGQKHRPTKWLKDQFPPYGKREWTFGANVQENATNLENLKKRHKKFLKHQKPGCEHYGDPFMNEDI